MERRDDVFRRKLAHTDGAKVVDSRLDEWSYARMHGRTGTRTSCGAEGGDAVTWRDGTSKVELKR